MAHLSVNKHMYHVSLAINAHQEATKQASKFDQPSKYRQVYLNTLARMAVNFYLQILGIKTAWQASDSNDPIYQALLDISDLVIVGYGKIECRPIFEDQEEIEIVPEISRERIAYIFVEIDPCLNEASILGFLPQPNQAIIDLSELQSLDDFPNYLVTWKQESSTKLVRAIDNVGGRIMTEYSKAITRLTAWLETQFAGEDSTIWTLEIESACRLFPPLTTTSNQAPDALKLFLINEIKNSSSEITLLENIQRLHKIEPRHPQVITRLVQLTQNASEESMKWNAALMLGEIEPQHPQSAVCCFKLINIDNSRPIRLRMAIRKESIDNYTILASIYPVDSEHYLPYNLQLQICDDLGNLAIGDIDTSKGYLRGQINGNIGEKFSIKINSGKKLVRENFII
jgi:hypothetical protein